MSVRVQTEDFDLSTEVAALRVGRPEVGAIVAFVGTVRDLAAEGGLSSMTLEHYPGMTERSLASICQQAQERWDVHDTLVIHRVGELLPQDQIVLVVASSAHRHAAFEACAFIMDYLKTQAPFWKKEVTAAGARWVEARQSDDAAAERWQQEARP